MCVVFMEYFCSYLGWSCSVSPLFLISNNHTCVDYSECFYTIDGPLLYELQVICSDWLLLNNLKDMEKQLHVEWWNEGVKFRL